ncbi:hypothetical protein [Nesterenkonia ebinurensis]|uniref:hypothetical protein n=1 Tax=Nesterenkonia ebinurensis TaxID=2608252 RepID=UPI00123E2D2A|nr:hypothetical protein [Nesterenkonia ebinurensis]
MTEHRDPAEATENDDATAPQAAASESAQDSEGFPLADPEFEDLLDEADQQIEPPSDIGENAQQVVTALLGHQQDLVAELRSVYERLEQVREVDYAALEDRVNQAEAVVEAAPSTAELEELVGLLEGVSGSLQEHESKQAELEQNLRETAEHQAAQLAERDARIAAQNARIEELEAAITAAAESAESAHEKLQVLAKETNSSLIHRVGERVSPAAQQAKSALSNIRNRFRR